MKNTLLRIGSSAFSMIALMVLIGLLAISCNSALNLDGETELAKGEGRVFIKIGNGEARTLMPTEFDDLSEFSYEVLFRNDYSGEEIEKDISGLSHSENLRAGTWEIYIDAFKNEDLVGNYHEWITVTAGESTPVNAVLTFTGNMTQDDAGILSYNVTLPAGATGTLSVLDMGYALVGEEVVLSAGLNEDEISLPSTDYYLDIRIEDGGKEKSYFKPAQIYDNAVTPAVVGLDDFSVKPLIPDVRLSMMDFWEEDIDLHEGFFNIDNIVLIQNEDTSIVVGLARNENITAEGWQIDDVGMGNGSTISLNADDFAIGVHTLTLSFSDGFISFSGEISFSVHETQPNSGVELSSSTTVGGENVSELTGYDYIGEARENATTVLLPPSVKTGVDLIADFVSGSENAIIYALITAARDQWDPWEEFFVSTNTTGLDFSQPAPTSPFGDVDRAETLWLKVVSEDLNTTKYYCFEVLFNEVMLFSVSRGIAGDTEITGLTPGHAYILQSFDKNTNQNLQYVVNADGTVGEMMDQIAQMQLMMDPSSLPTLTADRITGLENNSLQYMVMRVIITPLTNGDVIDAEMTGGGKATSILLNSLNIGDSITIAAGAMTDVFTPSLFLVADGIGLGVENSVMDNYVYNFETVPGMFDGARYRFTNCTGGAMMNIDDNTPIMVMNGDPSFSATITVEAL